MSALCWLGLHRWSRWGSSFWVCRHEERSSHVLPRFYHDRLVERWCQRCNVPSRKRLESVMFDEYQVDHIPRCAVRKAELVTK